MSLGHEEPGASGRAGQDSINGMSGSMQEQASGLEQIRQRSVEVPSRQRQCPEHTIGRVIWRCRGLVASPLAVRLDHQVGECAASITGKTHSSLSPVQPEDRARLVRCC